MIKEGEHLVITTEEFDDWLDSYQGKDQRTIAREVSKMELGNFGVVKLVRPGIYEKKVNIGPGYRLYFTQKDGFIIVLLLGGEKTTQDRDIEKAVKIASALK